MDFPNSEFWNYSTQMWALPQVESNCLELQDFFDIDVNLLLYCCWAGDKNLNLCDDDLQMLLDTSQPWQTIIKPLRDSRKTMQQQSIAMPSKLIEQTVTNMSEMELNAEHMAQLALEKALDLTKISPCSGQPAIECSLNNLKTYFNTLDSVSSIDELMPYISQLLSSIYQDEEAVQLALMNNTALG